MRLVAWSLLCSSTGVYHRFPTIRKPGSFMRAPEAAPGDSRERSPDGESLLSPMVRQGRLSAATPPAPPGAFHPGIVCAVEKQIIVGYRYDRPATAADRAAALAAGYVPTDAFSVCQEVYDEMPAAEQTTFEPIAPLVDPAKLAVAAFVSALVLGLGGGVLSTARFLDGSPNGMPPLDDLQEYAELQSYSPAEALVGLIFRPPRS